MNIKNFISTALIGLSLTFAGIASAAVPWGSTAPLQVSSATPTCTYTSTALACINKMTANETSLTLAGMTTGTYYTMIFLQDGTGSRTLTQTAISGAPALTTAESAANGYAVWKIVATSASAANFVEDYSNLSLWDTWNQTGSSAIAGTAVAAAGTAITQAIPTVVVPGLAATNSCSCQTQTIPGVNVALTTECIPATNAAECVWYNASAASVTATTATFNVRIAP